MFPSLLPSATIPAGTKRSSAIPPRRANDDRTDRCDRVRRANPAPPAPPHPTSTPPSDSCIASLEAYWQHAGKYDQQVGAFAQFLPRAFLQPYAEFRAALMPKAPMVVTVRVCPLCGARPLMGVLRVEGDSGKRFLLCSFCSQEWEFPRILSPTSADEAEAKLPVYVPAQCLPIP